MPAPKLKVLLIDFYRENKAEQSLNKVYEICKKHEKEKCNWH